MFSQRFARTLSRLPFHTALAAAASIALASISAAQTANCPAPSTTGCAASTLQTVVYEAAFPASSVSPQCPPTPGPTDYFAAPNWNTATDPCPLVCPLVLPRFDPALVPGGGCKKLLQAELQFEGFLYGDIAATNTGGFGCAASISARTDFLITHPTLLPVPCQFQTSVNFLFNLPSGGSAFAPIPLLSIACPDVAAGQPPICFTSPSVLASEFLAGPAGATFSLGHAALSDSLVVGCSSLAVQFRNCSRIRARVLYTYCDVGTPGASFCAGDNLDPLVTTPCPCGNFGAPGRGCANSANGSGALLTASGCAVAAPDTITLSASAMSGTSAVTFLKGDLSTAAGVPFFDGVRCVDGTLIRLASNPSAGGASSYPLAGQQPLSVRGATPIGSGLTGYYQASYRNASTVFCPPGTANITNGYRIVW